MRSRSRPGTTALACHLPLPSSSFATHSGRSTSGGNWTGRTAMFDMSAGTQMVVIFFILLALRLPVAFALGLSAIYAMWALGFGLDLAGDLIASGIAKYSLLAVPFFILAGVLMGSLGIAERMIRFFR